MSEDKLDRIILGQTRLETLLEAHSAADTVAHNEFRRELVRIEERQREDKRELQERQQAHAVRIGKLEVAHATISVRVGLWGGIAGIIGGMGGLVAVILQLVSR